MHTFKRNALLALGSFVAGIVVFHWYSVYAALAVPTVVMLIAASLPLRKAEADSRAGNIESPQAAPPAPPLEGSRSRPGRQEPAASPAGQAAAAAPESSEQRPIADPELASASEYIGVIQDMILLEGEKASLDDEIVQKTLLLLSRINRLIPDLDVLGDSNMNYNIVRLVRRDLNSTINPFLRLSGEAKRQNRRLLLDGIKDINSKLTSYTQTIEQKDLLELRTKAELIQQRYRYND
ncbi:hypothetical protein [Cohnella fermenti]|uniref:5-bromo-4-chloroindolyl phosphate hydrolysis protein n=1 Tax=Cohnella fermenti TaxID=2565925 RepID=A0A4S4CAQ7_9BACL|nr:hypothetical protein [Cohnella fermenti]THF84538.1 hypothetical protein E6C55_00715 [Cohnella fermenti]